MTSRELTAAVQVAGVILVLGWLGLDVTANGLGASIPDAAVRLVWATGGLIVFNILATIAAVIVISIVLGRAYSDEKPDERDRLIATRASRNGYIVTSSFAALSLLALAFAGIDPVLAVYALFLAPVLGGTTDAVSQLVYYRIG